MKKFEITFNEYTIKEVVRELQQGTDYEEVIPDAETRKYFESLHLFMLNSVRSKLIDAIGDFTKKRMWESNVTCVKVKLNLLEVSALYYELQENTDVILQLQSIVLNQKIDKLLLTNGR